MTGLRLWDRDPSLPLAAGDRELRAPAEEQVAGWVAEHLTTSDAPAPRSTTWVYARWKPGVSLTNAYELTTGGDQQQIVVVKRYLDGKDREIAERLREEDQGSVAHLEDQRSVMWVSTADRELPGIPALQDQRYLARWVEEAALAPPRSVRRRRTRWQLLRFKPERRCVARIDLSLRDTEPRKRSFIARIHPPARLATILARRRALQEAGGSSLTPAFLGGDERLGFLFEEWLDVRVPEPDSFAHATAAGELLARLHGLPLAAGPALEKAGELEDLAPLFSVQEGLHALARAAFMTVEACSAPVWMHGDFHPDQVALEAAGGRRLLDLDGVAGGDPRRDLASWIADHLFEQPEASLAAASLPLLEGYRSGGGRPFEIDDLRAHVCRALVERAAASIRRLERGAIERARGTLEHARDLVTAAPAVPRGSSTPLRAALARVRGQGDPESQLERVSVERSGVISLTLAGGEGTRWFTCDHQGLVERSPPTDAALSVSGLMKERSVVLSYRPGRRVVFEGEGGRSVVKGFRKGKSKASAERHRIAERAARLGGLAPARLLSHDSEHSTLRFERLEGRLPVLDGSDTATFRELGSALRRFQSTEARELDFFGVENDLEVLEDWRTRVLGAVGALPVRWSETHEAVRSLSRSLPSGESGLCHRDLHDGQVIVASSGPAVLDFDLLCRADVALDPANLLAHLELRLLQGLRSAIRSGVGESRAAFLDGLGRSDQGGFDERLSFYGASTFLRLALLYSLRPRWQHLSPILVRRAERLLASPRVI